MTFKVSSGLRDTLNVSQALGPALAGGFIDIYSGSVPATADASIGAAVLLCTISSSASGVGLLFDTVSSGGVFTKSGTQTWSGVNVASGTASFFRFRLGSDTGALSTSQWRLQGDIATSSSDLNMASTTLTVSALTTISTFAITTPTS
jgi:hypothetical protein